MDVDAILGYLWTGRFCCNNWKSLLVKKNIPWR